MKVSILIMSIALAGCAYNGAPQDRTVQLGPRDRVRLAPHEMDRYQCANDAADLRCNAVAGGGRLTEHLCMCMQTR